ncbi:MAG: hypothetical protein SFH39_12485 [Candidatus Magnetobacterium sp. LHC-1]|uniref:Uncharacterized protein n=1 Tax=Candidatus Magnetobacterium casense TaxID=1455061 RepID=A0ABS6S3Z5_9BACT|nr:hypothetical protein [Candidatus Magnetobacterium casensis]MBF0608263.1 hypothetical protein [Nitrospirota bacterium]MBV6343565.1 hypothetical protein [Candidatus Magnetobacterium casensis]
MTSLDLATVPDVKAYGTYPAYADNVRHSNAMIATFAPATCFKTSILNLIESTSELF